MTATTEYHVAITSDAPDFESVYAVFSTADKAEEFVESVFAKSSHEYASRAVITPQSYDADEAEWADIKRHDISWDTRNDDRDYDYDDEE